MTAKIKLSYPMGQVYAQIDTERGELPMHCGCTNASLKGLKNRGLIEMRGINPRNGFYSDFEVRRVPQPTSVSVQS